MEWWENAVVYQIYPRSFADSNGDGEGDLPGIRDRLAYLAELGVDAVWLSPFYPSPLKDSGYDVSDYCAVDPRFGTLDDFDALLAEANSLSLRVLVDIVPNHCSAEHPLFKAALAAGPGSPERELFLFRRTTDGKPPNNWPSFFGGSAWTQLPDGDWYLHLFDSSQPDWNWRNPKVHAMFEDILRFWLDRGVAGFRIDVGNAMYKAEGLPDLTIPEPTDGHPLTHQGDRGTPFQDQPELVDHYRSWRRLLDSYGTSGFPGQRIMVGETWADDPDVARPLIEAGMTQSFDFRLIGKEWDAKVWHDTIVAAHKAELGLGSTPWAIGNHDVPRVATRLGVDETDLDTLRESLPSMPIDAERGLARARAAALILLGLPGSVYIYQGDELGLPEHLRIPASQRQDPMFLRGTNLGRDGCRVPLPWGGSEPAYEFSDITHTWLPMPDDWADLTIETQHKSDDSTLGLYRQALQMRRRIDGPVEWISRGPRVLAYRRGAFHCRVDFETAEVTWELGSKT